MGAPRPVAKGCDVDALHPPGCNDVDTDQEHGRGLDSPADSARAWQNFGADLDCAVAKSRPHANEDSGTDEEIPLPNVKTAILSKASFRVACSLFVCLWHVCGLAEGLQSLGSCIPFPSSVALYSSQCTNVNCITLRKMRNSS